MDCLRATFARLPGSLQYGLLILGTFFALSPQTRAQNIVYATTNAAAFGTLNLDTGDFAERGTSSRPLAGLGELGANLYSVALNSGAFEQVSLADGSLTPIASDTQRYKGFGATTNTLYAVNTDGNLCHYILEGGTIVGGCFTPILFGAGTLAMSADGSALYAAYDSGTGSILYSLDTTLGGSTAIGPTDVAGITSLVFLHGTLYAATATGGIYTLNLQNGQATFHASTSVVAVGMAVPASTFSVLHTFTGHDGANPEAGLTMDRAGNLYGTTYAGGTSRDGDGTVYKLTNHSGSWILSSLYDFQGSDGAGPLAPVTIGSDGALYGTTNSGGEDSGLILRLHPPPAFCRSVDCPWGEQPIYVSQRGTTPGSFGSGALIFDAAGNIYGTSEGGGANGQGTVFELTPAGGGNWNLSIIYSFENNNQDGRIPQSGVIFDNAGNLYGTTRTGGSNNDGTVYQLTLSGGSWTEHIVHNFTGTDGYYPIGGLLFDGINTYYGTTSHGGALGGGTVFQLVNNNGSWTYNLLYSFPHLGGTSTGPDGGVIRDASGNLYGTTYSGGNGFGSVFELTPSNGGWIYTELYDFTGGNDGAQPFGNLVFDSVGNLYGTASCIQACPQSVRGTVYKVTPQ